MRLTKSLRWEIYDFLSGQSFSFCSYYMEIERKYHTSNRNGTKSWTRSNVDRL